MNGRLSLVSAVVAFLMTIVANIAIVANIPEVASEISALVLADGGTGGHLEELMPLIAVMEDLVSLEETVPGTPLSNHDEVLGAVFDHIVNDMGIPLDHINPRVVGFAAMMGFVLGFIADLVKGIFGGKFSLNLALGTALGMTSSVLLQSVLIG